MSAGNEGKRTVYTYRAEVATAQPSYTGQKPPSLLVPKRQPCKLANWPHGEADHSYGPSGDGAYHGRSRTNKHLRSASTSPDTSEDESGTHTTRRAHQRRRWA